MEDARHFPRKNDSILIIVLLTLLTFLTQYVFRYVDDNTLTSWQWTFSGLDASRIFFLLLAGITASYLLSRYSFPEKNPVIFLFLASFVFGALYWQEPEVILDTSRYFTQAKHLETYGIGYFWAEWGKDINVWTDLPLVPFLYGLIFKFFGESRLYIQIFTTFLFSMTAIFTYLIGQMLWDSDTGFYGGILLLAIPFLFTQAPLMLVDVPTMFFLTFAIFAFIMALSKGGSWIVISSLAIFLAVFSKYSTWLMLSVLVVVLLVYLIQSYKPETQKPKIGTRSCLYRGALIALLSALVTGIIIIYKLDVISGQLSLLNEYQKPGLRRWGESFISTFLFQVHPFVTTAALCSVYAAIKKRDLKYLIILWLVLLIFVLQITRARYILITFPMFTLMASYGLQMITNREVKRFIVFCAIFSSLIVAGFSYLPFLKNMSPANLKNAGAFLSAINTDSVKVYTLPAKETLVNPAIAVPVLDLFTDKAVHYEYDRGHLPLFNDIKESSVRFTWEFTNPLYYASNSNTVRDKAVVVISNSSDDKIPENIEKGIEGYKITGKFMSSAGNFLYNPMVTVYQLRD
ncbi:MAG: glycosyltransferase family 39 protein [Nitrospirae bacterium]|nr:glycosyltransferase family 39 protein [Nitrospirota bacterium]